MPRTITREQFINAVNDFLTRKSEKYKNLTWYETYVEFSLLSGQVETMSMQATYCNASFYEIDKLSQDLCQHFCLPMGSIKAVGNVSGPATFAISYIDKLIQNPNVILKISDPLQIEKHKMNNDYFIGYADRNASERLLNKTKKPHLRIGNDGNSLVLSEIKNGFCIHKIFTSPTLPAYSNITLLTQEEFDALMDKGIHYLQQVETKPQQELNAQSTQIEVAHKNGMGR